MVRKYTTFPKAPITEALLDIRVELPTDTSLNTLELYQNEIKERYPIKEERFEWKTGIEFQSGKPQISEHSGGRKGYLFRSADKLKVVQSRLDGFTFNKLKPYEHWEVFRDEAEELWNHYIDIARPTKVVRMALRYINRIELPLPFDDLKEYILTGPELAPELKLPLSNFLVRLEIFNNDLDCKAIITETLEKPITRQDKTFFPLIFDIDVFKVVNNDPSDKESWEIFESLRNFKNDIFFESITPKTKELFQ